MDDIPADFPHVHITSDDKLYPDHIDDDFAIIQWGPCLRCGCIVRMIYLRYSEAGYDGTMETKCTNEKCPVGDEEPLKLPLAWRKSVHGVLDLDEEKDHWVPPWYKGDDDEPIQSEAP